MADSYVRHIEVYVNSSTSPSQQSASVQAITTLLKNNLLTLETLVRGMDLYLTTTDSIIRARGILLLGELLAQLQMKPLSRAAISSWIRFFTEKLEDWKALRGALVGCLALMRRKIDVGVITEDEAKAVAKSYMLNLQVQSVEQHDRKLCFELLECLMEHYPVAVQALGDELPYVICAAIDEEKDPQCLMHAFHIVELATNIFAEPVSPFANYAEELFDVLGNYFPVHFTHPKGEDVDISRDELSRALMLAFASSPLFEPFAIPLLLDKLSSSLPSAKVESLTYLSYCTLKYGPVRMARHAEALWSSLKDIVYTSPHTGLMFELGSRGDVDSKQTDIMNEALILLQKLIEQNSDDLLNLVVHDKEINEFISSFSQSKDVSNIPMQRRQRLHAIGRILSVSAKSSAASCNRVFEKFFPHLMEALGLTIGNPSENDYHVVDSLCFARQDFEALYLCIELIDACRNLVVGLKEPTSVFECGRETWCSILHGFSRSLTHVFFNSINSIDAENSAENTYSYLAVRGLQILATFPGHFPAMSASLYEEILLKLVSVLISDFKEKFLWELILRSLVEIGLFIDQHPDSKRASSFESIAVEKTLSLISSDNSSMPLALKLQAVLDIGMTGQKSMLRVVQELNEAIFSSFTQAYVDGNLCSIDLMIKLLESYSNKVLPWFQTNGSSEDVLLNFVVNMLEKIESCSAFGLVVPNNVNVDLLSATMISIKEAVACFSEERQKTIVHKGIRLLLSSNTSGLKDSMFGTSQSGDSNHCHSHRLVSCRDEWILSLFASIVIALRPETQVPDVKMISQLFVMNLLRGHVPSAQALGSLVNKLPSRDSSLGSEECSLEEAMEVIINSKMWNLCKLNNLDECPVLGVDRKMGFSNLTLCGENCAHIQICCAIVGLAWIGKGLVLRGHERIKEITMTFFSLFLLQNGNTGGLLQLHGLVEGYTEQEVVSLMKSASDAFHIIMSDSEACLNRKYNATIRTLYKQRFYNTLMPILTSSALKSDFSITRSMLARSFAHIVSETPLSAIVHDAKMVIPLLLDCLSTLQENLLNKDVIYNVILVMSGILLEKNGAEAVLENAHTIVKQLIVLVSYPYMMVIRETAIQCLVAMSQLPYARIYPLRTQVLQAISKALDDPKRAVREAAVRCRQAWASIASRSLHF